MSSFRPLLSSTVALTSIELLVYESSTGNAMDRFAVVVFSAHMLYGLYAFVVWTVLKGDWTKAGQAIALGLVLLCIWA